MPKVYNDLTPLLAQLSPPKDLETPLNPRLDAQEELHRRYKETYGLFARGPGHSNFEDRYIAEMRPEGLSLLPGCVSLVDLGSTIIIRKNIDPANIPRISNNCEFQQQLQLEHIPKAHLYI